MSKPIELGDYRPHKTGMVICRGCFHEWVGVAPVGTQTFECPDCGRMEGRMLEDATPEAKR